MPWILWCGDFAGTQGTDRLAGDLAGYGAGGGPRRAWVIANPSTRDGYLKTPSTTSFLDISMDDALKAALLEKDGEALVRAPHAMHRGGSGTFALYNRNQPGDFCASVLLADLDLAAGTGAILDMYPPASGADWPLDLPSCARSATWGNAYFALTDADVGEVPAAAPTDLIVFHGTAAPFQATLLDATGGELTPLITFEADWDAYEGDMGMPYRFAHIGRPNPL